VERTPIVIVGGGLAGSATALHLARRGQPVCLLERGEFPRETVCGEGLMPHGAHELAQLGLLESVLATKPQPYAGIGYRVGEVRAEGRFPGGKTGLGIRRSRVDSVMHAACQAEPNIDVRTQVRVSDVVHEPDGVRVKTSDGPIHAQVVVGADGLGSLIRRKSGLKLDAKGSPRYGVRMHVRLAEGASNSDFVEVQLGEELEWYVTPTGPGQANIALLCEKSVAKTFGGNLEDTFWSMVRNEPHLDRWSEGAEPISQAKLCGPLRQEVRSTATDRVVLVGDAAGFVDAITGEGMSLSLLEARIAADVLADALTRRDTSRASLMRYHRMRVRQSRSLVWFTRILLFGLRHRTLTHHIIRNLARHPEAFGRLLGVNIGDRALWRVPPRDLIRLTAGV